jgi:putative toxin-antitoxin system antitoxin component (TIGR02293 family)
MSREEGNKETALNFQLPAFAPSLFKPGACASTAAKERLDFRTKCRILYVRMTTRLTEKSVQSLEKLNGLAQTQLIEFITAGLPARLARELAQRMDLTMQDMAGLLRLNPRTLQRRLDDDVLSLGESERLWELSQLFFRAVAVLGSEPGAVHWLKNPIQALGGETALSYARTSVGVRELDDILGRIEHGVYS